MLSDDQINAVAEQFSRTEKIVDYNIKYSDWNIDLLFKDTLWVQRLDEPDADLFTTGNSGLLLTLDQLRKTKGLYSIGKVIKVGTEVKHTKIDDYVMFGATGIGQTAQKPIDGYQTYFLRESDIIAIVSKPADV